MDEKKLRATVRTLDARLGTTLVAVLAGSPNAAAPAGWAHDRGPLPDARTRERLRVALEVGELVAGEEGDDVARAWCIGANPLPGDKPPVTALRAGRVDDVRGAATALVEGAWSA